MYNAPLPLCIYMAKYEWHFVQFILFDSLRLALISFVSFHSFELYSFIWIVFIPFQSGLQPLNQTLQGWAIRVYRLYYSTSPSRISNKLAKNRRSVPVFASPCGCLPILIHYPKDTLCFRFYCGGSRLFVHECEFPEVTCRIFRCVLASL